MDAHADDRPRGRGRPLSFPVAVFRVARIAPLHVLRGRRLLGLLLLLLAPVAVAVILRALGHTGTLGLRGFVDSTLRFYVQVGLPLTMLFLGAAAIGDDIDNGTVLYLRLRPVPRAAIVVGRYISACLSAVVLVMPMLASLFLVQVGLDAEALARALPVLGAAALASLLAILCYGGFFLLLSLLMRHAVLVGVLVLSAWELALSRIPAPAARLTVAFHERALLSHVTDEGRSLRRWLRPFEELDLIPAPAHSVLGLLSASLVLLLAAAWVFRVREYAERPGDA